MFVSLIVPENDVSVYKNERECEPLRMDALVNKVEVKKFQAFDPKTGAPDPGYILQMTVTDVDTNDTHQCSFNEGFGLEELRQARKLKAPEAERDQLAGQVEAAAKPMEGQRVMLVVGKPRAKGFVTFPVVTVQSATTA